MKLFSNSSKSNKKDGTSTSTTTTKKVERRRLSPKRGEETQPQEEATENGGGEQRSRKNKFWGVGTRTKNKTAAADTHQQQQNNNGSSSSSTSPPRGGTASATAGGGGRNSNNNNGNNNNNNMTVFRVMVPDNINPGEEFQVYAGNRIVRVRCPMDSRPGQSLQITVPSDSSNNLNNNNNINNKNKGRLSMNGYSNNQNGSTDGPKRLNSTASSSNSTNSSISMQQQQQQSSSIPSPPPPPQLPSNQSTGSTASSLASDNSLGVKRIPESDPPAYMVSIPEGVETGKQFPVTIRGQQLMVTCPPDARPGMRVRIIPPPILNDDDDNNNNINSEGMVPPTTDLRQTVSNFGGTSTEFASQQYKKQQQQRKQQQQQQQEREKTQLFEVEVPRGVQPGAPFALLAGGVRVLVTCPENAGPGQRIRFKLPLALTQATQQLADGRNNTDGGQQQHNEMQQIRLKYDKDGWTRTVRVTDLKFQWIRYDDQGKLDLMAGGRFQMDKSAYVRRLEFRQGEDPRVRNGVLSLVSATESVVDSKIKSANGRDLVTYSDLAQAQMKNFDDKTQWFQDTCSKLCVEWNEGHMRMNIRRSHLLGDSVDAVMSLSRKDLRKVWRFEFIGEMGIDAGGLAREWFELVCQAIFDPDRGLWVSSATNQMSMTINPASEFCIDNHLVYYRFLGRVMGKAMFDQQLVKGHMVKHLYKHILGWPIYFKDLESIDEEYYNNLRQLSTMHDNGEDISMLCLDFTMSSEIMGTRTEIELVPGGADIDVTNDNFPEYVEACFKYKLMGGVKSQLNELLLGFFDVIPEPLLTIFDYQELELIMCGLPHIDLDDWMTHTEYSGEFEDFGRHHPKVEWFWETLEEFNDEMRARLLLFVTGTSGVPSRGFGVLQSNDGNIRNFTIHGVSAEICFYPRAHTCFNRIDLPLYDSKEQLQERLKLAVTMSATGFDIE